MAQVNSICRNFGRFVLSIIYYLFLDFLSLIKSPKIPKLRQKYQHRTPAELSELHAIVPTNMRAIGFAIFINIVLAFLCLGFRGITNDVARLMQVRNTNTPCRLAARIPRM